MLIAEAYDTLSASPVLVLSLLNSRADAPPGTGTRFMRELCQWADQGRVTLSVFPLTLGKAVVQCGFKSTTSQERLVEFYQRFNFQPAGRHLRRPPQ